MRRGFQGRPYAECCNTRPWEGFCRLGPIALAAVLVLPSLAGVNLFRWPLEAVLFLIQQAIALGGG